MARPTAHVLHHVVMSTRIRTVSYLRHTLPLALSFVYLWRPQTGSLADIIRLNIHGIYVDEILGEIEPTFGVLDFRPHLVCHRISYTQTIVFTVGLWSSTQQAQ